jgi:CheY-like chemotaxis protein
LGSSSNTQNLLFKKETDINTIKKILIVDDESVFLNILSESLTGSGRKLCVLTAEDGLAALKILESEQVELVVTDLKMPRMDGYQLASILMHTYPNTTVMVMSAVITPETERRLCSLGISHWFEKPIHADDLASKISMETEGKKKGGGV